jgi:hypothetical protein
MGRLVFKLFWFRAEAQRRAEAAEGLSYAR